MPKRAGPRLARAPVGEPAAEPGQAALLDDHQARLLAEEDFVRRHLVDLFYQHYLQRAAEGEGRGYWVGRLVTGDTIEQVAGGFLDSAEYIKNRTNGSIDGWLDAFYSDAFQRPATTTERANAENAFNRGHESRGRIAIQTFLAASAPGQTANEYEFDLVSSYFQQLLDRQADAGGLQFWATRLQEGIRGLSGGISDERVLAGMIGETSLQEFYQKAALRRV